MQRILLPSALVIIGISLAACGSDGTSTHGDGLAASVAEPLSVNQFDGTSLKPKQLALTFDDGPGVRAADISAYLRDEGIRAAFFVVGERIAPSKSLPNNFDQTPNAANILAQIVADGHLIGNHATSHRDLTKLTAKDAVAELTETDTLIAPYTQPNKLLFRAPTGAWNTTTANNLIKSDMNKYVGPINWNIGGTSNNYPNAAADWACWQNSLVGKSGNGKGGASPTQCGDAYLNEINSVGRGIVLMHDPLFINDDPAQGGTYEMLTYILPKLKAQGYTFVRLDEVPDIKDALPPCSKNCVTCSGPNANQCDSCAEGKFLAGGTCTTCSTCADGTYQATACTATTDTVCLPCPEGMTAAECASCGDECTVAVCDAETGDCDAGQAADGGSDSGGGAPPPSSITDTATIDSGSASSNGGCNVGHARGGHGAVALGALAWLIARRKRTSRR